MKIKACGVLLAAMAASSAFAAVEDCPAPGAGAEALTGAVSDFPMLPAICRAPDYTTSLEPVTAGGTVPQVAGATVATPTLVVDDKAAEEAGLLPVMQDKGAGGIQGGFNDRQMQRIGEWDAMGGKPINMNYASDLGYLQGYTRGQQARHGGRP